MQSEECGQADGMISADATGYAIFQLAGMLGTPEWRNSLSLAFPACDLVALDIRRCLHYLGEITGEITNEDQLDYIFSKFCIGK